MKTIKTKITVKGVPKVKIIQHVDKKTPVTVTKMKKSEYNKTKAVPKKTGSKTMRTKC